MERLNATETALYRLTDRLFRAERSTDVYEASLDAIVSILGCARASILLFDRCGVMRFVAWRARRAVGGHSPWKPDDKVADPIYIDDIEEAGDLSDELKAVIRAEGLPPWRSFQFLQAGRSSGNSWRTSMRSHAFTTREIDAGVTIVRQFGFGLERLRGEEAMRRIASIVETSDDAIISKNLDGVIET